MRVAQFILSILVCVTATFASEIREFNLPTLEKLGNELSHRDEIFGERFAQRMHCSQRFFAGKNRTFFKTLDVLPSKLPRLVEQQWELSMICDSSHGRLFVCRYIARMERMG
jgi:hypothetical protein